MVRDLPALIKHVGRGARLAKDLPRDEAAQVMRALLTGEADPVQVGGFLIAMRMKAESAEELAGFVDAMRAAAAPLELAADARPLVDVDLHGDGREGRPSLMLPAACLAAAAGARVLVRGAFASAWAANDLGESYATLGVDPHRGRGAAVRALAEAGVAVLDLTDVLPAAAELLALRARLGVRTCVNTCVKLLDPAGARRALVGIFHGPYHEPVAGALVRLGAIRALVVQAPGGLPEPSPDRPTRVSTVERGAFGEPVPLPPGGSAPPPLVATAGELAALAEKVLAAPAEAPSGAVQMAVRTAALVLWAAGLSPAPDAPATVARLEDLLRDGRGARTLAVVRSCYGSLGGAPWPATTPSPK